MRKIFIAVLCIFFLASCKKNVLHEEYKVLDDHIWHTDSIKSFVFSVEDTINTYKITLRIRHTTDYEFQNLFLFLQLDKRDTVEIKLANKDGSWIGRGFGDVRELEFIYKNNFIFAEKTKVVFKIEQAMRYGDFSKIEKLNNILAVGVSIIKKDG